MAKKRPPVTKEQKPPRARDLVRAGVEIPRPPNWKPTYLQTEEVVYRLAQTCLSLPTIAHALNVSEDLLNYKFGHLLDEARAHRKVTLVEAMWDKALNGKDTHMQIWLSKQHLGYRDVKTEGDGTVTINISSADLPSQLRDVIEVAPTKIEHKE